MRPFPVDPLNRPAPVIDGLDHAASCALPELIQQRGWG
jgi:hypothetical protein